MSKMIELHDIDVPGFLSVLDSCEGNVYLMTRDGDKLNLKSKLCQLIGLTSLSRQERSQKPLWSAIMTDDPSCSCFNLYNGRNAR